jgi:hypothetical protein
LRRNSITSACLAGLFLYSLMAYFFAFFWTTRLGPDTPKIVHLLGRLTYLHLYNSAYATGNFSQNPV